MNEDNLVDGIALEDKGIVVPQRYKLMSPGVHIFSVDVRPGKYFQFQVHIDGHGILGDLPTAVFVQTRSPGNDNPQFTDEYVVYVNQTFRTYLNLRVLRVDKDREPSAHVRFDIMWIE